MFIVLGNRSLADYPQGGGHWSWFLQYPLGLKDLGHRVFWLEVLHSSGNRDNDASRVREFFSRIAGYGLERDCAAVVIEDLDVQDLAGAEVFNSSVQEIGEIARSADMFWNLACSIRRPLLSNFRRRVLIDVDPGHLQVSATDWDLGIADHEVHLSVGANLHDPDCEVPTLGFTWRRFFPFVYLPHWEPSPDPGPQAAFTSITQWTWAELWFNGRALSVSKRAAYLRYAELPRLSGRSFELAANIGDSDPGGDRITMSGGGWRLADPHQIAPTPEKYRDYIRASRAEIQCPKPVFRELNTGWFSDRSVAYMATGRPVLAEETGFSRRIPSDRGVIAFTDLESARAGVAEIDGNYATHSRAAREIASDLFGSRRQLTAMIDACG